MHNTRLIRLLKSLNHKEFLEFGRYLKFIKRDEKVIGLYKFLKKYEAREYSSKVLTKEKGFYWVFGTTKVFDPKRDTRKIQGVMNHLSLAVQDFLVKKELEYRSIERDFLLLAAMQRRHLENDFFQITKDLKKRVITQSTLNFNRLAILNNKKYFHISTDKMRSEARVILDESLKYSERWYALQFVKYVCEAIFRKIVIGETINELSIIQAEQFCKKYASESAIFEIYTIIIALIKDTPLIFNEKLYLAFKEIVEKNSYNLNEMEKNIIFGFFLNYINLTKRNLKTRFELHQWGIQNELCFTYGYLPSSIFKNVFIMATELEELEWANVFYNTYLTKVIEKDRNNVGNITRAYLLFAHKEFDAVIAFLHKVEMTNISYKLQRRTLLLRSYYENKQRSVLINESDAFSAFLRNNKLRSKIGENLYLSNKKFLKILIKILNFEYTNVSKSDLLKIVNTERMVCKNWLRKTINQL